MRSILLVLVVTLTIAQPAFAGTAPSVLLPRAWYEVVDPYHYAETRRFEGGWNRGADVVAAQGVVRSPVAGRVRFVGAVAGRQVATIASRIDGVEAIATFTGLSDVRLRAGDDVPVGGVVGRGVRVHVGAYDAARHSRYFPMIVASVAATIPQVEPRSSGAGLPMFRPPRHGISGAVVDRLEDAVNGGAEDATPAGVASDQGHQIAAGGIPLESGQAGIAAAASEWAPTPAARVTAHWPEVQSLVLRIAMHTSLARGSLGDARANGNTVHAGRRAWPQASAAVRAPGSPSNQSALGGESSSDGRGSAPRSNPATRAGSGAGTGLGAGGPLSVALAHLATAPRAVDTGPNRTSGADLDLDVGAGTQSGHGSGMGALVAASSDVESIVVGLPLLGLLGACAQRRRRRAQLSTQEAPRRTRPEHVLLMPAPPPLPRVVIEPHPSEACELPLTWDDREGGRSCADRPSSHQPVECP